jgi:bla regulator protein BlaR1
MDKRIDNTDLPFVFDEMLVGIWGYSNFVKEMIDFTPDISPLADDPLLKRMKFATDGKVYVDIGAGTLIESYFTWTKGFILNKYDETCSSYLIQQIGGDTYLLFEWKTGDYSFRMMDPYFYVFKKLS